MMPASAGTVPARQRVPIPGLPRRLRSNAGLAALFVCTALAFSLWMSIITHDRYPASSAGWRSSLSISQFRDGSRGWNPWRSLPPSSLVNGYLAEQEKLQSLAQFKKRRFLVRDWSIWLGWNNVRYMIETGLMLAKLLDRELVLPSFTWANTCQKDDRVCAELAPFFLYDVPVDLAGLSNRTLYPDPDDGTTVLKPQVPSHNWKGWILPVDHMLDLQHLISTWGHAIRFQDFLKVTNPHQHSIGMHNGKWSTHYSTGMTYRSIPNALFTNFSKTMVDHWPSPIKPLLGADSDPSVPRSLIEKCQATLDVVDSKIPNRKMKRDGSFPTWDENLIQGDQLTGPLSLKDHPMLERCLATRDLRSVYGYTMAGWWMKAPYGPTKFVRRLSNMIGIYDELGGHDEQVLHIEGELHNGFPPASMLWTSLEGRAEFERLVRTAIKPPEVYDTVAARLELKMRSRCQGRGWRASHMRRGDFLSYEWTAKDINKQWTRIESNINYGISMIEKEPSLLKPAHEAFNTSLEPPKVEDPFYLATNTRIKEELEFLRTKNIVLLTDLLDEEDERILGKVASSLMDTLAVLEQCLIMRSSFFYGDAHSSMAGLILNRRNFYHIDERLTKIEYFKFPGDGQRKR